MRLALVVLLSLACARVEDSAVRREAIYGGALAPDDHAVFMLHPVGCTAALIAPRTLLTAAHCVDDPPPQFATNAVDGLGGTSYPVVLSQSHSGQSGDWTPDLALVLLARAPPVTPLRWQATGPFPTVGTTVRHVGYGLTETGTAAERRTVSVPIRGAGSPQRFGISLMSGENGQSICFGDSGGPALVRDALGERVAAVHSYTQFCGGLSGSALVFPYARFVGDWLARHEAASCARDTRCVEGCSPVDVDCTCGADGRCSAECFDGDDPDCPAGCRADGDCRPASVCPVDLDCLPIGTGCLRESQCASRLCLSDPQNPTRYCTIACPAGGCPTGFQCDAARSVCIKSQRERVPAGAPCAPGSLCVDGYRCAAVGSTSRCEKACVAGSECLSSDRCDFSLGICVRRPAVTLDAGTEWEGPTASVGCSAVSASGLLPAAALVLLLRRRRQGTTCSAKPMPAPVAGSPWLGQ